MPSTTQPEHYVDATTVAEYLSLRRELVVRLARKGIIPSYPIDYQAGKKLYRFRLSEIDAAMKQNRLGAQASPRNNVPVLGSPSKATKGKTNG